MKPMRMSVFVAALLVAACSSGQDETANKAPVPATQGREETKNIRALDTVGVEGTAISKQVDQALDANDKRKQQLDKAMEEDR